ncbi:versican core protein-like [Scomber japonicus]|uniref:versican core protein-like n=1 Tax=Scomber japonicus TaxID=13676 RepID=UPI002305B548|nr:versican core protein-like [Scomber japonicus]
MKLPVVTHLLFLLCVCSARPPPDIVSSPPVLHPEAPVESAAPEASRTTQPNHPQKPSTWYRIVKARERDQPPAGFRDKDHLTSPPAMKMETSSPVSGSLAGQVVLPCYFSILPVAPGDGSGSPLLRIRWTKLEEQAEEKVVLVATGGMVKVGSEFMGRVLLPSHPLAVGDASLTMERLRASDAGLYRCEVMHGNEDTQDTVRLNVSGVVFHYRSDTSRYTMNFPDAVQTCQAVGASIATPEQLTAAFEDGFDRCDAGWLADKSVRYPIAVPRPGCFGELLNRPGIRTYGVRDSTEKYDVFCFVDKLHGEVFYPSISDKLTLQEARDECKKHESVLASPGQLFAAWRAGLNRCDYGWLSDGSARYPITVPRPQCGGGLLGVRTLYKFKNQTGFPDPTERHGLFCFKGKTLLNTTEVVKGRTQASYRSIHREIPPGVPEGGGHSAQDQCLVPGPETHGPETPHRAQNLQVPKTLTPSKVVQQHRIKWPPAKQHRLARAHIGP